MSSGLQPFLSDAIVALRAPTQVWSSRTGDLGAQPIDGVYHGDTRFIREAELTYTVDGAASSPEPISVAEVSASTVEFGALLRGIDDRWPDPKVRLLRTRTVSAGAVRERLTVRSHLEASVSTTLRLRLAPDLTPLQDVKAGEPHSRDWRAERHEAGARVTGDGATMTLSAPDARIDVGDAVTLEWDVTCPEHGEWSAEWTATLDDPALVVRAGSPEPRWTGTDASAAVPTEIHVDPRLRRWSERALSDLDALRLALPHHPEDEFLAAGAPWFFTLFGRDSLWAARLLLPHDAGIAASTLRVLARLQGTATDPATAEQPGKILHELRAGQFVMPGEGIVLPPVYYGTVDATPLWVALLAEASRAGMPKAEVRALIPHLRAALDWIVTSAGDDGFLDYVDETGHGLSNQGWKDSGDSIQWRDGTLAEGPIALCEVQGYAYEAAMAGADLLDSLGEAGAEPLRVWAQGLRTRFAERFWVTTPEGTYPAIALDRDGRPVDTLTSNIGHLLGTGILDPDQERSIARLLTGASMSSGFGLRTMSTDAAGYWPLSYHGGSVWPHDAAIVARGMARAGCRDEALAIVDGLLAAAESFDFRMPELYAGDARSDTPLPAPYPAACRPQAWSAAAAIACLEIVRSV
ncbi:amylo-alpha-1,6-glucosidase [Microbacterium sp. 4R-513]|uniref:glycogen debranching N-terminal domain-containing protein n=1 Tax=Microbacterium sp. 4R-513 TaxID=2567934 RepID=UPI0013E14BEB|nr:glycogen debranching N-terminal domain-containing protein [Microbacterium sp. 4R-513]QIG40095.1 amylo-alpha-1,6-glucosidase [Microbacterium sp. 4R-513]